MNTPRIRRVWITFLVPLSVVAQTAKSPDSDTQKNTDPEVLNLSPFLVNAAEDEGYGSKFSTSGSRLKTDLTDIAASVTVLTDDFMNDLGANDVASALAFVSGAETDSTFHNETVAGLSSGNGYVGGDFGDNNNRSGEVRVRGLGSATTTINYIETIGSTDRYNTDRSEFLRGANSILFGLAQPAGLLNSSTKVAKTRKDAYNVDTKVDNLGSVRVVLDINKVLIRDVLALRVVGLTNNQEYRVKTAYQKDKRLFLAGTYQPFKGTTVRAYYENIHGDGRRPNNRTVQDNVSDWLTAYNKYAPQMTQAQIDAAFFWDPTVRNSNGLAPVSTFTLANGTTVNLGQIRRTNDTKDAGTVALFYPEDGWSTPYGGVLTTLANRTQTGALPAAALRSYFYRSGSNDENRAGYRADPQVTDTGIFPYKDVEIAALPGNYRDERDHKFNLTIDQKITDNFYLSATYQTEDRTLDQNFEFITQTNAIQIDINKKLPDGRANPGFKRPYILGRSGGEAQDVKFDNLLLQANYDFDFAEKTTRFGWLGLHRFTSLYTKAKNDRLRWQPLWVIDSLSPDVFQGAAAAITDSNRWNLQAYYVGDPVQVGDTALRFTGFPDSIAKDNNGSYGMLYFDGASQTWKTSAAPVHVGRSVSQGQRSYTIQKNDGYGFSLQSFFWKKKIVTLYGWRTDAVDSFTGIAKSPTSKPFPYFPASSRDDFETVGSVYKNSAATSTKSIVYKITNKVRVFANRSENFAATTPRQDSLYRQLAPQSGQTDELGFGLNFMNGRLDIRATHFESSQINATSNTAVPGLNIPPFEQRFRAALITAGRFSEWNTISQTGGTTTDDYERPDNASSTEDSVSKGESVEILFRPSRHWDLVASVDKVKNVKTNVGHEVGDFLAVRAPFYKKFFDQGLTLDGTIATPYDSTNTRLLSTNFVSNVAVNYVNQLATEGISNPGLSEYSARMVARYKFLDGALKGLNIGTNIRWEDAKVIGYAQIPFTYNFGGLTDYKGVASDTSTPYYSDTQISGGMFVSYSRKIWNGRVNWRVQLNAQNLFSKTGLVVFAINPDQSPVWARYPDHSFELSNSFQF